MFQYPLGLLADKKTGEKELLIIAILVMGMFTGVISFINSDQVIIWMIVLFCTRIGAATIEVLRDSYFYKQIGPENVDLIDFFRITRSVAYVVGMVLSGTCILLLPLKSIFVILALIIFSGLIPLWRLKIQDSEL